MIAEKTDIKHNFLSQFEQTSCMPSHVVNDALTQIEKLHFPENKEEYWKYTRPTKILNSTFSTATTSELGSLEPFKIPGLDAFRVVLLDGKFSAKHSELSGLPTDVKVIDLASDHQQPEEISLIGSLSTDERNIFSSINTAYASGGVAIIGKNKVQLEKPIHIIHIQTVNNAVSQPRILIIGESRSSLHIIQTYKTTVSTRTFTNVVTEVFVKQNARISIDKVQYENDESLQLASEYVHQERDSYFKINTVTLNGSWVRNNLNISIDGVNCETHLNGLYPLNGHQHVDNHTLVDHRQPHCESHELYKGILSENSNGVFNGKVFVRRDAQKTNAFQQNANIIMSENAQVNTKPELEIYADDVKCSHGCTTGQFDEEAVFYLRSRGISEENARNLLVYAFAGEVLDKIEILPLQEMVRELMSERFNWEH